MEIHGKVPQNQILSAQEDRIVFILSGPGRCYRSFSVARLAIAENQAQPVDAVVAGGSTSIVGLHVK